MTGARERALAESPFLAGLARGEATTRAALADHDLPVGRRLRLERRLVALDVALGDLSGALDFNAVVGALTRFADHALHTAIVAALAERLDVHVAAGEMRPAGTSATCGRTTTGGSTSKPG